MTVSSALPTLGVVVVAFNSEDVILDCLESLFAARGVNLHIVVVDNASTDGTLSLLRQWSTGDHVYTAPDDIPFDLSTSTKPIDLNGAPSHQSGHKLTLIETGVNGGFAGGVNAGLAHLATQTDIERFWILNPDSVSPPETPAHFATEQSEAGQFSLMGGRVLYLDPPDQIQIDGGTINTKVGVTGNLNLGADHRSTPPAQVDEMDFITGASMVASRAFYEQSGPMEEDYFLYYEEVDWALRRGDLPLAYCANGIVYHRAGTAIGSPTLGRPASPFSLYFKHRGRIRFVKRHFPKSLPFALLYSFAKAGQMLLKGFPVEAWTVLGASLGAGPIRQVRSRLSKEAQVRAFK